MDAYSVLKYFALIFLFFFLISLLLPFYIITNNDYSSVISVQNIFNLFLEYFISMSFFLEK